MSPKRITPLWKDPVGWAAQAAKTRQRVYVSILLYSLFMVIVVGHSYMYLYLVAYPRLDPYFLMLSAAPILLASIGWLALLLYALYRLLQIIEDIRGGLQSGTEKPPR